MKYSLCLKRRLITEQIKYALKLFEHIFFFACLRRFSRIPFRRRLRNKKWCDILYYTLFSILLSSYIYNCPLRQSPLRLTPLLFITFFLAKVVQKHVSLLQCLPSRTSQNRHFSGGFLFSRLIFYSDVHAIIASRLCSPILIYIKTFLSLEFRIHLRVLIFFNSSANLLERFIKKKNNNNNRFLPKQSIYLSITDVSILLWGWTYLKNKSTPNIKIYYYS